MRLLLIILIISFVSCKQENKEVLDTSLSIEKQDFDKMKVLYSQNDTIIKLKHTSDYSGVILWGVENNFMNHSKDTIQIDGRESSQIKWLGNVAMLTKSCGTACDYAILMSFEDENKGRTIFYPLATDAKNKVICYVGNDSEVLLNIENLKTNKKVAIKVDFDKTLRPPSLAIDSIIIVNENTIKLWWFDSQSKKRKKTIIL